MGDALTVLRSMAPDSVHCCITSPPYYGLRDYGCEGQIGLERTPAEYIAKLVAVFAEVRRVLRPDGTCWVNIGDSYAGSWGSQGGQGAGAVHGRSACAVRQIAAAAKKLSKTGSMPEASGLKPKDLIGIPWMLAFALRDDGWWLRQDIIWHKPNPMPESVRDRCTKAHEYLFLLTKSERYWWDAEANKEPASEVTPSHRNRRSVWTLAPQPTPEAHFATFPLELPELCMRAGCPETGTVLDPFAGAGTTALACLKNNRQFIGVELNPQYIAIADKRLRDRYPLFA